MIPARHVIAEKLRRDYESEHETNEPVTAWYPQADEILRGLLDAGYMVVPLARRVDNGSHSVRT